MESKKRGRPATGNKYPMGLTVMVTDKMYFDINVLAVDQGRSTAFVIRDLLQRALKSSSQSGCGNGCTCRQ